MSLSAQPSSDADCGNAACNKPVCSHLMHLALAKPSAFHKPECCCAAGVYFTILLLYYWKQTSALHCKRSVSAPTEHSVQFRSSVPAHSLVCPHAICILLCLPTVFCVHRQSVSCCASPVFCVHRQSVFCCACPQFSVSTGSLYPAVPPQCSMSTGSLYPAVPAHNLLCPHAACILCTVRHRQRIPETAAYIRPVINSTLSVATYGLAEVRLRRRLCFMPLPQKKAPYLPRPM